MPNFNFGRLISHKLAKEEEDDDPFNCFGPEEAPQRPQSRTQSRSIHMSVPSLIHRRASIDPIVIPNPRSLHNVSTPIPPLPLTPPHTCSHPASRRASGASYGTPSRSGTPPSSLSPEIRHVMSLYQDSSLETLPSPGQYRPPTPLRTPPFSPPLFQFPDEVNPESASPNISRDTAPALEEPLPLCLSPAGSDLSEKPPKAAKKDKKEKKKKRKSTKPPSSSSRNLKTPSRGHSRWTFTENIADLFSGQMFRKLEATEMLTPQQLKECARKREAEGYELDETNGEDDRISIESISSDVLHMEDSEVTPVEPFHLEDLASRIEAAYLEYSNEPSELEGSAAPEVVRRDFSVPRKPVHGDEGVSPLTPAGSSRSFPDPPKKNPARFQNHTHSRSMPTIPELLVTTPEEERYSPSSVAADNSAPPSPTSAAGTSIRRLLEPYEDEDFVFLNSTPCTVTMPTIKHGPIRIPKSEISMKLGGEATLDWTAFQMAILGGAGDFFYGSADVFSSRGSEEAEAADLSAWFGEFGFSSGGRLISSNAAEQAYDSPVEVMEIMEGSPSSGEYFLDSPASSVYSDDDDDDDDLDLDLDPRSVDIGSNLPIPVESEFASGFWNKGQQQVSDAERFAAGSRCGIRRWTVEGHPKPYVRRASYASDEGDQSGAMMPYEFTNGGYNGGKMAGGTGGVRMGSNLGDDLGDFLKWEAENVCAPGF